MTFIADYVPSQDNLHPMPFGAPSAVARATLATSQSQPGPTVDPLTGVLEHVRLSAAVLPTGQLSGSWGFDVTGAHASAYVRAMLGEQPDGAGVFGYFYFVQAGKCWLEVEGVERGRVLNAGDLVFIPQGQSHKITDSANSPARPILQAVTGQANNRKLTAPVSNGAGSGVFTAPSSRLMCGVFAYQGHSHHWVLSSLPAMLHLAGQDGRAASAFELILQAIDREVAGFRPGAQAVIDRMTSLLFVQAVRDQFAASNKESALSGLLDPDIGASLCLIHKQPQVQWTVASLADKVAMSRSAYAARFTQCIGEPPLSYVTRVRMQKAADLLCDGLFGVKEIAVKVGYGSGAAFSSAFKRFYGVAPGSYRKNQRLPGMNLPENTSMAIGA